MSTKSERAERAKRRIIPIKVPVRQKDGTIDVQTIDADVSVDKRRKRKTDKEHRE
jgi:hypothetical protein